METESADLTVGIESRQTCQPCREQGHERTAMYWCFNCPDLLCENCYDHHKVLKGTRNHKLLGIDDYQSIGADIVELNSNCKYHPKNLIEYLCLTHNMPCCVKCKRELHGVGCDIKPKDEILKGSDQGAEVINTIETISRLIDDVEKSASIQGQNTSQLEEQRSMFYEKLKSERENIDRFLDVFEERVKINFENMLTSAREKILEHVKILQEKRLDLIKRRATVQKIQELGGFPDLKLYLINNRFHRHNANDESQMKDICDEAQNIPCTSKPVFEVDEELKVITLIDVIYSQSENKTQEQEQVQCTSDDLDHTLSTAKTEIEELGISSSVVEAEEEHENPSSTEVSKKDLDRINCDEDNTDTAIESDSYELTKHFFIEHRKKDFSIRCSRFLKEDKLVMTESSEYKILVYYTNGRKIGQVKVDKWPDEIAVLNCDKVAVACRENLVFIDTNEMVLLKKKTFGEVIRGIGYAKEQIFVCLVHKGINVLDDLGNIIKYIPFIRGNLYICATINGCVFSAKRLPNALIFSFCEESNVRVRYHLVNPLVVNGITCDNDNNIYLATNSSSIIKLDAITKTFSTILSADNGLHRPYNVDYCKDSNQLLIIDKGKEVKIFTKQKNT